MSIVFDHTWIPVIGSIITMSMTGGILFYQIMIFRQLRWLEEQERRRRHEHTTDTKPE